MNTTKNSEAHLMNIVKNKIKKKGLPVTPGKGQIVKMVVGEGGVKVPIVMFTERTVAPGAPEKSWIYGEVTRVVVDSRDEVQDRVKQRAVVFATEEEAAGMIFRRCPDPFAGKDPGGTVRTNLYLRQAVSSDTV